MSNNKDIETNTNENTQKSETPKKKNIVHVIRCLLYTSDAADD